MPFQNLVNKMWLGVASQDKMELRSCLPKLLLAQHKAMPFFIRNKLCKVIVDIGRQDWPMFYHDFFTNTLQVCPAKIVLNMLCWLCQYSKLIFYLNSPSQMVHRGSTNFPLALNLTQVVAYQEGIGQGS